MTKLIIRSLILFSMLLVNTGHAKVYQSDEDVENFAYSYDKCNDLTDSVATKRVTVSLSAALIGGAGGLNSLRIAYKIFTAVFGSGETITKFDMYALPVGAILSVAGQATYNASQNYFSFSHPKMIADLISNITIHRNDLKSSTILTQLIEDMDTVCFEKSMREKFYCKTSFNKRDTVVRLLIDASNENKLCEDYIPNKQELYEELLTE